MSNAQPEPSMEEILASIRRIISEDGEEEGAAPAKETPRSQAMQPPRPAAAASPAPAPTPVKSEPAKPEARTSRETMEAPAMKSQTAEAMQDEEDILADTTAHAATQAFHSLSQSLRVSTGEGRTLEDIVTDLLKPLVKEWLDANLPAIVEEKVEDEVQRLARRRR